MKGRTSDTEQPIVVIVVDDWDQDDTAVDNLTDSEDVHIPP